MGELHLDIYVERMKREYNCECTTGQPQVAYRETISQRVPFNYTHKKQTGGSGQYGKVMGYIEPILPDKNYVPNEFQDATIGSNVPKQYVPAIEKGFMEGCDKGKLIGHKIVGVRMVLEDGAAHAVDSSETSFKTAAMGAFREAFDKSRPLVLEPVMNVDTIVPLEYQGGAVALINKRKGTVNDTETQDNFVTISSDVSFSRRRCF
jgi:elongation factor G